MTTLVGELSMLSSNMFFYCARCNTQQESKARKRLLIKETCFNEHPPATHLLLMFMTWPALVSAVPNSSLLFKYSNSPVVFSNEHNRSDEVGCSNWDCNRGKSCIASPISRSPVSAPEKHLVARLSFCYRGEKNALTLSVCVCLNTIVLNGLALAELSHRDSERGG